MQSLRKIYRSNYAGENIITNLVRKDGEWNPTVEFVPNSVFNTFTTTQAVAIGNGESRREFNLKMIGNHQGGLLAANKLQSYGCNALYRDFTPDFLIATGDQIVYEISKSGYCKDNIVYANADVITKYPGKFYLVPQNPMFNSGALAVYMACFDGHKKIFLMGYDMYDGDDLVNNIYKDSYGYPKRTDRDNGEFFSTSLWWIMRLYDDVEFVWVMPSGYHKTPERLAALPNFRQIDYRGFVLEADVGVLSLSN